MRTRSIATLIAMAVRLLVVSLSANGQAVVLKGLVLSTVGAPLQGATVEYATGKGVATDTEGLFEIKLGPQTSCRLKVRILGYAPLDTTLQLQPPLTYAVFKLQEQAYDQPEVVVSGATQSIFERSDWLVKDLKVVNGRIYALYKQNGRHYVLAAIFTLSTR